MKIVFPIPPLLLLAAFPAAADPILECNQGVSSQVEIGACVAETAERVDVAVEAALSFAMVSATDLDEITEREVAAPALDAAQVAWEAYRDAHCEFVGSTFGGASGTGIAIAACRVELGRARAAELMLYAR